MAEQHRKKKKRRRRRRFPLILIACILIVIVCTGSAAAHRNRDSGEFALDERARAAAEMEKRVKDKTGKHSVYASEDDQTDPEGQAKEPGEDQTASDGQSKESGDDQTVSDGQAKKPGEDQTVSRGQAKETGEDQTVSGSSRKKFTWNIPFLIEKNRIRKDQTASKGNGKKEDEWNLTLVNPWNALPDDFTVELADLPDGHQVDVRCRDALLQMLSDCRADGLSPVIASAYRTMEKQVELYENKVKRLYDEGMDWDRAYELAATTVAYPGTSEHQLGLALDIVDESYQLLDHEQENTAVQKWLMENSWKYGFILRYPNEKSEITGIIYEPWHYRYVGKEAAKEITEAGLCLEEYLGRVEK